MCYGTGWYSAKELTVLPKRTVTIKDSAAYGIILTQGYGMFGSLRVSTPAMIRFGDMTEDELFVSAEAAQQGVRIENLERQRSAGDPEAFRPGQSRRRTAPRREEHDHDRRYAHKWPAIHNAMWPGLVGKGPDSEPPIDLDTMLDLTAQAAANGMKFDGVDLFLFDPHVSIDATDDDLKRAARQDCRARFCRRLAGRAGVAAHRRRLGHGQRRGSQELRDAGPQSVRDRPEAEGPRHPHLRRGAHRFGLEPERVGRGSGRQHEEDRRHLPRRRATSPRTTARRSPPKGEICWGGMHSWKRMTELLEMVNRPTTLGFQADMAHTLLYTMGYNAPEDRILPEGYDWKDRGQLQAALKQVTDALRPWTKDFHVAQNDATVKGSGSHDKTGRHCLPHDPNGKLDIVHDAGYWLRDEKRPADQSDAAYLLGRLHVPERDHDAASRRGATFSE